MHTAHHHPDVSDRGSARHTADSPSREERIVAHMGLVKSLARRYANRGETLDDLIQVGMIGLINAVDRFDPDRDVAFPSFATPTIIGEIRRHFRDRMWAVKVPRGLQEANARVNHALDDLTATLHRSPSIREITDASGLSETEVLDALAVGAAYRPAPFAVDDGDGDTAVVEVAVEDPGFATAEDRTVLSGVLSRLPLRERRILLLRYFADMSQADIGARLGISQMHVSRLLAKSRATLAAEMADDAVAAFAFDGPRH